MASRIQISSLAKGTVQSTLGPAVFNASVAIFQANTTNPVTVYVAPTGGGTIPQPLRTDHEGDCPGWLTAQQIVDVSINGGPIIQVNVATGTPALADLTDGAALLNAVSPLIDAFVLSNPGTPRYISPTGGGTGLSPASPTTLANVINIVNPGDTVYFLPGLYTYSTQQQFGRSGSAGAPITFTSLRGRNTVVCKWTGGTVGGGMFQTNNGTPWTGSAYMIFENLTFDCANGIGGAISVLRGSHHVLVRFNTIKNGSTSGIQFNGCDYTIAYRNLIWHCGYNSGWGSAIGQWYGGLGGNIWGGATASYDNYPGFHNVIVGNVISGVYDGSTHHSDGNGIIVDGSGAIPPILIAGNVVYHCGGSGITTQNNTGDVWVVNNTLFMNGLDLTMASGQGADLDSHGETNCHWVNNLIYSRYNGTTYTTGYGLNNDGGVKVQRGNAVFNATDTGPSGGAYIIDSAASPVFVAAPALPAGGTPYASAIPPWYLANGLSLASTSPAINTGSDPRQILPPQYRNDYGHWLAADASGKPRVSGSNIDVGAYEFQGQDNALSFKAAVLGDGPVSYYRFNDFTNPAGLIGPMFADLIGLNHGSYDGGYTFQQAGALTGETDTCALFNGTTGYATVPFSTSFATPNFGVVIWAKPTAVTSTNATLAANRRSQTGWKIWANTTALNCDLGNGTTTLAMPAVAGVFAAGTWVCIGLSYDGTTARLYVNGVQQSTLATAAYAVPTVGAMNFANDPWAFANYFPGYLDEAAIFDYAPSAAQFAQFYAAR